MEQEVIRESLDSGHGSSILLQMSLARTPQQMENSLVSLLTIHSFSLNDFVPAIRETPTCEKYSPTQRNISG
jgi:hypothetical protein